MENPIMGCKYEVQLWCVLDFADGEEGWGWEIVYYGDSLLKAIKAARYARKSTDGAVRVYWR
jgi:hypothetical protein